MSDLYLHVSNFDICSSCISDLGIKVVILLTFFPPTHSLKVTKPFKPTCFRHQIEVLRELVPMYGLQYNIDTFVFEFLCFILLLLFDSHRFTYEIGVYCVSNYYGKDCQTYCLATSDNMGHYVCETGTGRKICTKGICSSLLHRTLSELSTVNNVFMEYFILLTFHLAIF